MDDEYSEAALEQEAGTRKRVYTVTALNREIRSLLEGRLMHICLEGEISNFKHHTSGHMYLSLKDEKSQINAVFFSRNNASLKFRLKDGLKVLVYGRISVYEPRGQYQVYIERVEPQGLGALQLAFLQLKEKLQKEGLFDIARKRPIPKFPRVVGIVTSPTGAAIRDILNVVNRRFHGTEVLIYPVRVQGEGAAAEISEAIRAMNKLGGIDVLIVGRGGGSLEDLWAFNEEEVARAIFESGIPVISAVGHEIDWTICDLVADLRAPTPSAAAELVVQNREELERRFCEIQVRMKNAVVFQLGNARNRLETLVCSYALKQPLYLVGQYSQRLDELLRQLQNYMKSVVSDKKHGLGQLVGRLEALSPLSILMRGYSLTMDEKGSLLRDAKKIKPGDTVVTRLWKGNLKCRVLESNREDGND